MEISKFLHVDYIKSTSSSNEYEFDTNPNNEVGYNFNNGVTFEDEYPTQFIKLVNRIANWLNDGGYTQHDVYVQMSTDYYYAHNHRGYDSEEERETQDMTIVITEMHNDALANETLIMLQEFFDAKVSISSEESFGKMFFFLSSNGNLFKGHYDEDGKGFIVTPKLAGYGKPNGASVKGYHCPYPQYEDPRGNYQEEQFNRFLNGEKPLSFDEWQNGAEKADKDDWEKCGISYEDWQEMSEDERQDALDAEYEARCEARWYSDYGYDYDY